MEAQQIDDCTSTDLDLIHGEIRRIGLKSRSFSTVGGMSHLAGSVVVACGSSLKFVDINQGSIVGNRSASYCVSDFCYLSQKSVLVCGARYAPILALYKIDPTDFSEIESIDPEMWQREDSLDRASISCVAASEEFWANRLLSSEGNLGVVYDLERAIPIQLLHHRRTVSGASISRRFLATASVDQPVRLWCPNTLNLEFELACNVSLTSVVIPKKRDHSILAAGRGRLFVFDDRNLSEPAVALWNDAVETLVEISEDHFASIQQRVCAVFEYRKIGDSAEAECHRWTLPGAGFGLCSVPPRQQSDFESMDEEERLFYLMEREEVVFSVTIELADSLQLWGFQWASTEVSIFPEDQ